MIAIVAICKDEADVVDLWIRHHLSEGIDHFYVADASTDGTKDILKSYDQVTVVDDTEPYCFQQRWTNEMIALAHDAGADWQIASDVDEFWYSCDGRTVAEALTDCPHEVVAARSFQHLDWNIRQPNHKILPKVAFRSRPGASVSMGNHAVNLGAGALGVLDLREIQFRSLAHYVAKVRSRLATLDPSASARGDAAHYTWLAGKTDDELRVTWEAMWSDKITDPIPSHLSQ